MTMSERDIDLLVQLFKLEKAVEGVLMSIKGQMEKGEWETAWERFRKYCE